MRAKLKPPSEPFPTCFGMHHSGVLRFIAMVALIMVVLGTPLWTYDVLNTLKGNGIALHDRTSLLLRMVFWSYVLAQTVAGFILNIILFLQSLKPNPHFLLYYSIYYMTTYPAICIYYYVLQFMGYKFPYFFTFLPGLTLYRLYVCSVVLRYRKDIEKDKRWQSGYRNLTDEEIGQFEFGEGESFAPFESPKEMAYALRYSRDEFEIPQEDLDLSEATTLGFGEYGHVYKAVLTKRNKRGEETLISVAVKTVDPELSNVNHFLALLTEVKVMTFIGNHENVVGLIGVTTDQIRLRKLYIVCEICLLGNLKAHLRSNRNTFVDWTRHESNVEEKSEDAVCTKDLIKWSFEIACGMEYLASRRVVHGDLAARNVLLNDMKTAKIADFGLSRKLYNYSIYVKRDKAPLPWRHLAIESLVDMNFSVKSDIWSYGICCWEIFELGGVPWMEHPNFTFDFIQALKDGKRMEQPRYSTKEIYEILVSCWKEEPGRRPKFSEIYDKLRSIYADMTINKVNS